MISLLAAQCAAGQAQNLEDPATRSAVSTPALGLLFDPARGLRPLLGIPGAAAMGEPLELPFRVSAAAVSPRQDYALILAGEERECRLLRLEAGANAAVVIDGAAPGAGRVVLSPSGRAAALYREADGLLQVITGLPNAPSIAWQDHAPEPLASLALSDDGEALLAGFADQTAETMVWVTGVARPIPLGAVSGLAFGVESKDAAAVTAEGAVWSIRDVTTTAECRLVAGPEPRFSDAAAIALSGDGARIYIASRSGAIASVALDGTAVETADCRCAPSGLYPLHRAGLFRLNEPSRRPLMLWDAAAQPARFWFVPADPPDTGGEAAGEAQ